MQFNSYIFILVFLPVFIIGYYLLGRLKDLPAKLFIILAGIVFYLYGGWDRAYVFLVSIAVNLSAALIMKKTAEHRKAVFVSAVTVNVLLLFFYKYFDFTASSVCSAFGKEYVTHDIALPLGISFFTFQQIMYIASVYKEEIEDVSIADYLAYILFFPKLIMGPLAEPKDLIAQLGDEKRRHVNWDNMACGIKIFCLGFFKKMVLADTFASAAGWGYENAAAATSMDMILAALFYTFEIYFDFSGYTDMAVGVSSMMNIDLPMNFDSPYRAVSIRDFWKRWHISLTKFLTKYIYFPLGGNRKGTARTYANILAVFLISGIWHGANWTFILWGLLHGLLQVIERLAGAAFEKIPKIIRWLYSFIAVSLLWLLFGAGSITQWKDMLARMFSPAGMSVSEGMMSAFALPENALIADILGLSQTAYPVIPLVLYTLAAFIICLVPQNNHRNLRKLSAVSIIACSAAFVWAFLCLSTESVFVYFNF